MRGVGSARVGFAERSVRLKWLDGQPAAEGHEYSALGQELAEALRDGGCAAVVCNTVGSAQRTYTALKEFFPTGELDLFHARFLFQGRQEREVRSVGRFGKQVGGSREGAKRPHRCVLVATQVIEQSLDLDFDLMVSEVAPVDLLIQRIGRLQRHERKRPRGLEVPTLWLIKPALDANGVPDFGSANEHVYEPHILLRTWLQMADRVGIAVPNDVEPLIEAVYGDSATPPDVSAALRDGWTATRRQKELRQDRLRRRAEPHLVEPPERSLSLLETTNEQLEEDNPSVAPVLQAVTRLADPSVPLVLLPSAMADGIDFGAVPGEKQSLDLLGRSVTLSHRGVVGYLLGAGHLSAPHLYPEGWRKSPLLRHHRLLLLNESGAAIVGGWEIRDDPDLGVLVKKAPMS